ncbi:MAG TPA: transporter substrate-binding domain-containing protein [Marinobacter sp.]|uniref:Transporter substrate-binding domain-containing protein n=2 Tax=root TaxID=1 RepID=A0A831R5Z4_9GAMM|nr:transporter substrate-binding domain-containing protein [Marinobacter antarcticus]HDZ37516.1 transporter substrate-binding domain-containing protein [Marinobacter sp.]HEA53765.1 transporter substrate-binding domain-containing protein [Marinobacter antarcticus]
MGYRPLVLGALASFMFQVCQAQPSDLDLVTFEAPPYQTTMLNGREKARIEGETVETVTCAAKQAGRPVHVTPAPQKRAMYSLEQNSVDGYFAVGPSAELDAIATRSDPVALEQWYFFMLDPQIRPDQARIGAVDGSNEEAWLEANGYDIYLRVTSPGQLAALLERGRIDMALMDKRVMDGLNTTNKTNTDRLHSLFLRYAPLYLYMSKTFQENHPEFLPAFNHALPACTKKTLTLNTWERSHIEALTNRLLAELTLRLDLQRALNAGPQPKTLAEVLAIDSKWQASAPMTAPPLAAHILSLPASHILKTWQQSHQGLVTEVLLINKMGTIAAMSQLTSDFWQGDEPKFLNVIGSEPSDDPQLRKTLFISPIRYDQSTARFQVIVSVPVFPDDGDAAIGVIAVGLDIEKAIDL